MNLRCEEFSSREFRQMMNNERILGHDILDLFPRRRLRQYNTTRSRYFTPGSDEHVFFVIFAQERHMTTHVGIKLVQCLYVIQVNNKHAKIRLDTLVFFMVIKI